MKHSVSSDIKQSLKIPVAAVILHKPPFGLFLGIFFILTFHTFCAGMHVGAGKQSTNTC